MKILLIRHGETTGDLEDRYGGWYDDDLTNRGRSQLESTGLQLQGQTINQFYISSLKRALQSAEIISKYVPAPVEVTDDFRERNYGVLGGLTKAEAIERYPEVVEAHKDPATTDPEGESQVDFQNRVLKKFIEVTSSDKETIAIISHGGTIKCILKHLNLPLPSKIGDGEVIELMV